MIFIVNLNVMDNKNSSYQVEFIHSRTCICLFNLLTFINDDDCVSKILDPCPPLPQILIDAPFLSIIKSNFRIPLSMHYMCLLVNTNFQKYSITRERERVTISILTIVNRYDKGKMKSFTVLVQDHITVCME